jgi:uncharacterized protein
VKRIDVFELARTGASVQQTLAPAQLARLAPTLAGIAGEIHFEFTGGIDERGRPAALLDLHATLPLRCDLCGRELRFTCDHQQRFFFVPTERELDAVPIDVEADEALLGSSAFDLAALVEDELILQLPISPRHPQCVPEVHETGSAARGGDEEPGGQAADRPHPFAALARLRKPGSN